MPPKKKTAGTRKRKPRSQTGKGLADIARFVKDHKLISKGLGLIPNPAAQVASKVAGMVGLGRRRRTRKKATTSRKKVLSVGSSAKTAATTKRRRVRRMPLATTQVGGGIFSDLGGGIGSVFGGLGHGIGSVAHGLFGAGRKHHRSRSAHPTGSRSRSVLSL